MGINDRGEGIGVRSIGIDCAEFFHRGGDRFMGLLDVSPGDRRQDGLGRIQFVDRCEPFQL